MGSRFGGLNRLIESMVLAIITIVVAMIVCGILGGILLGIVCSMAVSPGWTVAGLVVFAGLTAWFYVSGASMGEL